MIAPIRQWFRNVAVRFYLLCRPPHGLVLSVLARSLTVLGAVTVFGQAVQYWFPDSKLSASITDNVWNWLIGGAVASLLYSLPKRRWSFRLRDTDTRITLCVGSVFDCGGTVVVGMPDTFITDVGQGKAISEDSVLGQFVLRKYHGNGSRLQAELKQQLNPADADNGHYPLGTAVRIDVGQEGFILVAVAPFEYQAKMTQDDLIRALSGLWEFLDSRAGVATSIGIPLFGSKHGRIDCTRERIAVHAILSFVASSFESRFCDELIICVTPKDVVQVPMDLHPVVDLMRLEASRQIPADSKHVGTEAP